MVVVVAGLLGGGAIRIQTKCRLAVWWAGEVQNLDDDDERLETCHRLRIRHGTDKEGQEGASCCLPAHSVK